MRHLQTIIPILFLVVGLLLCGFFWYQILELENIKASPDQLNAIPLDKKTLKKKEIETILSSAKEFFFKDKIRPSLSSDPFKLPGIKTKQEPQQMIPTISTEQKPPQLNLSGICWSKVLPLAVINGEILTEGEYDSTLQFIVEKINSDEVEVRVGNKVYQLDMQYK